MRSGNKSDLIGCIEEVPTVLPTTEAPAVEEAVLERSGLVNMVKAKKNQSFQTYASNKTPIDTMSILFHLAITRKLTHGYLYKARIWH